MDFFLYFCARISFNKRTNLPMNSRVFSYIIICLLSLLPQCMLAQDSDEKLVEFFSENATMEDDPKKGNYNITIFSPDGQWKMQLNYYSDSMFGVFGNKEFRLDGDGKYYNYARNPKNDMVFYSFVDMNVTVTDEGNCTRIKANCLTNNKTRFKVEATIGNPEPKETRTDDLGYARVQPNSFYGTYVIHAENENYKLSYGIVGDELLGTFYRADLLVPELHDKKANKDIKFLNATAVHTKDGENTIMNIDLLSEDLVLYKLTMFNGPHDVEIKEEKDITFTQVVLQDLSDMYGCYQFGAMNSDYQVAIAVKSEAFASGKTEWAKDDLLMQYTNLLVSADNSFVDIFDISVRMEVKDKLVLVYADVTSMDGTLYHVTMRYEQNGYMPEPEETVNIDFGHVSMIDYSQGLGLVGFGAVKPGEYQMRFYLNATKLEGEFTGDDFYMDACDMMVVTGNTYVFHDAKYVKANMEKDGDKTMITVDMLGVDDVLYHGTMYIDNLNCLQEEVLYTADMTDDIYMVALQMGNENDYAEYTMQLQDIDNVFDDDDMIVGDGSVFSFYFGHSGTGIDGQYAMSDGTLADDQIQTFYENGCEVRVGTVAGTLSLELVEPLTLKIEDQTVKTNYYMINFKLLGQNGTIYNGEGSNYLLCIDLEGDFVDIIEDSQTAINEALAEHGLKVRKVLKGGKIIVEKDGSEYDTQGRKLN